MHPIFKCVCYSKLTPKFKASGANIEQVVIPRNINEALSHPLCKNIVYEEIRVLESNGQ